MNNASNSGSSLVIDIDGTLCPIKSSSESYSDLVPSAEIIDTIRKYQSLGFKIILFTARNMKTYKANLGEINKYTAPVLLEWLQRWNIPFDEVLFGKPWPGEKGFYVDDRTIRPREFLSLGAEEIEALIERDRLA